MLHLLESLFKWLFLLSLLVTLAAYLQKDELPEPHVYDLALLKEPQQTPTRMQPFETQTNGQNYRITPLFDYQLDGVIVSYNDSDSFTDTTHHRRWQDFLNIRDLCVIWGKNIESGVYQEMDFRNDSWTCWAYWPDGETRSRFSMHQLSNNHLLVDDYELQRRLMAAEVGDHVRLKGVLANYANPGNGFKRGTSTVRTDTGNGACETVYLEDFQVLNPVNSGVRRVYALAKWLTLASLAGFLILFVSSPVRKSRFR